MTRRHAAIAVAVLGLIVLALAVFLRMRPQLASRQSTAGGETPAIEATREPGQLILYFPGSGGSLIAEERSVETDGKANDLRTVAAQVLAGPESPELFAPFPAETGVGDVFVSENGIAYVDLVSAQLEPPRSGSRQEMLSVFSLVNSVHANMPELGGVVLLWNGQQRATFAGHLDTGRPLTENRGLVARGSRPAAAAATPAGPTGSSRP